MMNKGQISAGIVWTVVIMLVAVAFGGLIFGRVQNVAVEQTEGTGTTTTTATLNALFSDNTVGTIPDDWDNSIDTAGADNTAQGIANARNASGYVTATRTDNGDAEGTGDEGLDNQENSYWYQAFTLAGVGEGITAATVSYRFRVIENDNAADITIEVLLDDGSDNTRLTFENVTGSQSTSWTSRENNVADNIAAAGTYTLYLVARLTPQTTGYGWNADASNIQVGWDEVSISVNTYGSSVAENIIADVGETGAEIFPLILLLVLIGVFVAIIAILKVLG